MPLPNATRVLTYLTFVASIVWLAIANGGDATQVGVVGIVAALLVVIGEVREIEVANWLRITFGRSDRRSPPDDDP